MSNYKERICKVSGHKWRQYNSLQKCPCESCKKVSYSSVGKQKPNLKLKSFKPIKKVSDKQKALNQIYQKLRIEILTEANFKCFVDGCNRLANTIEHQKGRKGYADQWANDNNIPLLIDKRYLKPCCWHHNVEFENNPELSKEYQLSKLHDGKKD